MFFFTFSTAAAKESAMMLKAFLLITCDVVKTLEWVRIFEEGKQSLLKRETLFSFFFFVG